MSERSGNENQASIHELTDNYIREAKQTQIELYGLSGEEEDIEGLTADICRELIERAPYLGRQVQITGNILSVAPHPNDEEIKLLIEVPLAEPVEGVAVGFVHRQTARVIDGEVIDNTWTLCHLIYLYTTEGWEVSDRVTTESYIFAPIISSDLLVKDDVVFNQESLARQYSGIMEDLDEFIYEDSLNLGSKLEAIENYVRQLALPLDELSELVTYLNNMELVAPNLYNVAYDIVLRERDQGTYLYRPRNIADTSEVLYLSGLASRSAEMVNDVEVPNEFTTGQPLIMLKGSYFYEGEVADCYIPLNQVLVIEPIQS